MDINHALDDGLQDLSRLPVPVQTFLWRQIAPFVRPKLGKLHEANCMVSRHVHDYLYRPNKWQVISFVELSSKSIIMLNTSRIPHENSERKLNFHSLSRFVLFEFISCLC